MKTNLSLKRIDLTAAKQHECPEIRCDGTAYLAKFDNTKLMVGSFERQWYGLNFVCGFGVSGGFQFDAPGWNLSSWRELWEIVEAESVDEN